MIKNNRLGIIFSIIGIIASVLVIILKFIDKENVIIAIVLLCACILSLITNISNKK